jgi:hypothetical protein
MQASVLTGLKNQRIAAGLQSRGAKLHSIVFFARGRASAFFVVALWRQHKLLNSSG